MRDMYFYGYGEDEISCTVMKRLFKYHNELNNIAYQLKFRKGFPYNKKGKDNIKKIIPDLKNMNKNPNLYIFILTDLDRTNCAPDLVREWFPTGMKLSKNIVFRVAVREVEAWLLANRDKLAEFLSIDKSNFTDNPDSLDNPKRYLLELIRKKGRKSMHKRMLPSGGNASIGPEYNDRMCDFVINHWDIDIAKANSDSLQRAIRALQQI